MIRIVLLGVLAVTLAHNAKGTGITLSQLNAIMTYGSSSNNQKYLPYLNAAMRKYSINTPLRQAHFLAQVAHESGSLRHVVENLNYSEQSLLRVFGKYFIPKSLAKAYARKPRQIANRVYANRLGNGNEASGDGWKYRGRGLIQLTGKSNYQSYNRYISQDVLRSPDQVATNPALAVDVAGWFWNSKGLNYLADKDDVRAVTRKINGGYNGLEDRIRYLKKAKSVLRV